MKILNCFVVAIFHSVHSSHGFKSINELIFSSMTYRSDIWINRAWAALTWHTWRHSPTIVVQGVDFHRTSRITTKWNQGLSVRLELRTVLMIVKGWIQWIMSGQRQGIVSFYYFRNVESGWILGQDLRFEILRWPSSNISTISKLLRYPKLIYPRGRMTVYNIKPNYCKKIKFKILTIWNIVFD